MLGKKGEDKKPNEKDALVQRVDEMMDARITAPQPVKPPVPKARQNADTPPPLDIFKETKTAPPVPGKTFQPTDPPAEPKQSVPVANPASETITEPAEQEESAPGTNLITDENPRIENQETDEAVDDIVAHESDSLLAAEDETVKKAQKAAEPPVNDWRTKLKRILKSKKTWAIIAIITITLFAVPATRYKILGLVIKKQIAISVIDSKTKTPVSNARVVLSGTVAKTDANGVAKVKVRLGQDTLEISKQYYQPYDQKFFVGFGTKSKVGASVNATGRQVPLTVTNKVTGKPVANAEIKVLKTTAKTDKQGKATVVLPADESTSQATILAQGFNTAKVEVSVTSKEVKQNQFQLTPSGHVYFLSNQTGKIDVIRTNLDGTGRKVVLAGTGREDAASTSLLASRDWKYVVLKAKREGVRPALYLINTTDDKVTMIDGGNGEFNLVGWYSHYFMYSFTSNSVTQSQTGHQIVKSYDAERQQSNQLDQTQVDGQPSSYGYQSFANFYILNNLLSYTVQWSVYDAVGTYNLGSKNDSIRGVQPNGAAKKDYQTFSATNVSYIQAALNAPQEVYYGVFHIDGRPTFYELQNQAVTSNAGIDQDEINTAYPTYLVSPGGNQTFWTDLRDGKNTLFLGDNNAKNAKQIATLSDYSPYGWYGDNYLLVTKDKSQLYIIPAGTDSDNIQPVKITDYYKPATTLNGYGYGYGGL